MRTILLLLADLILFCLTGATVLGEGKGVTGVVIGRDGAPKALVGINLTGPDSFTALTDSEGRFQLGQLTPGCYLVTVSQRTNRQQFIYELRGGEHLKLEVRC